MADVEYAAGQTIPDYGRRVIVLREQDSGELTRKLNEVIPTEESRAAAQSGGLPQRCRDRCSVVPPAETPSSRFLLGRADGQPGRNRSVRNFRHTCAKRL